MKSSATVDTLVFQLEDEDPSVRWDTLQRLRKRAAVERAQLPVRNPRRFLHCLRRRLHDEDPRIARETLLLLADVVDVLREDLDQILSSVLPHLVPRLPSTQPTNDGSLDVAVHEETFAVFRKYANASNDLAGVANLLVDSGLAHTNASVREAALITLLRLLEERYSRRDGLPKKAAARVDAKLFTELMQAIVPVLEDTDERVVVAAEETIAKIQFFWGTAGFQDVMAHLSKEDKATLQAHDMVIQEFVMASTSECSLGLSVSASQVMKLRASVHVSPDALKTITSLQFGFVTLEVVDAITTNTGNSNAEWKKRTTAVEHLYAATKQVERQVLLVASRGEMGDPLMGLVEILLRLLQDIDVHIVKRSLQIQRLVFYKLEPADDEEETNLHRTQLVLRSIPTLIELAANYADDQDVTTHAYTLFQTVFSGGIVSVEALAQTLLGSLQHRRLQVREEALRVWIVLLLTAQLQLKSAKNILQDKTIHALGNVLGDGSSRVRQMAFELVAVFAFVTQKDVCAILESRLDDFTLERIDLDALYARIRDKRLPILLENGQLKLMDTTRNSGVQATTKLGQARPTSRVTGQGEPPERRSIPTPDGALRGRSDPLNLVEPEIESRDAFANLSQRSRVAECDRSAERKHAGEAVGQSCRGVPADNTHKPSDPSIHQREVMSAPTELIADKLQVLKRKTERLKKSESCNHVIQPSSNHHFNPQEGDFDFASADYAAPQPPPSKEPSKATAKESAKRARRRESQSIGVHQESPLDGNEVSVASSPISRSSGEGVLSEGAHSPPSPDDRPIRPMRAINFDDLPSSETNVEAKKRVVPISLATKKRLEAKQRTELKVNEEVDMPHVEPSPEAAPAPSLPISLATRKRLEAKSKAEVGPVEDYDKSTKRSGFSAVPEPRGKQEPRYLEARELIPLKDPKQHAATVVNQLQSDDWETSFEAMNVVRRLAAHHPKLLEDKIRGIITEVLKQVPNLRSSVSKNAMLALESLCNAYGKSIDGEVDNILPALMKRCTDSNTFVCESTSLAITSVILNCSTARVVNAIAAHVTSRAVPIRREVARSMHSVIVGLADQVQSSKEIAAIMNVVGKCLEDSNNEVRDAAKQSVIYLFNEQGMESDKLKKMLPVSAHSKVDALCTRNPTGFTRAAPMKPSTTSSQPGANSKVPGTKDANVRRASVLDTDALAALTKRLESGNWKDRFDALSETVEFITKHKTSLCESGKIVSLFDSIIKRLEDGNAKVSTLALELLPTVIVTLDSGMELVLQTFIPAISRALAASNSKQATLAQAAIQTLCDRVDARLSCQHIAAAAKNANSRVKPTLLDMLDQLAARRDDRIQSALTRYVLPLALELLKEGKSDVKEVNARLLRSLYASLGHAMLQGSSKLSSPQHDKLVAILGVQ